MRKAAELGLVEAQHNLGVMYLNGNPSNRDKSINTGDEVIALSW